MTLARIALGTVGVVGALVLLVVVVGTTAALACLPGATLPGATLPGRAPTPPPAATVAFYPVIDMRLIAPGLQDAVFGGLARTLPALTRAASPKDLVDGSLPPTMLVVGAADNFIRADLVRAHDAALRAAGVPGRLFQVPYADHVFDHPYGSPGGQIARPAVFAFVRERAWTATPRP